MKNTNEINFNMTYCDDNLAQYTDSLLFDSNTHIAGMICECQGVKIELDLMVRGTAVVDFNGYRYRKPSKYPEAVRNAVSKRAGKNFYYEDDLYLEVLENSWFEYIYSVTVEKEEVESDGIMFEENLHTFTKERLQEAMEEMCRSILRNYVDEYTEDNSNADESASESEWVDFDVTVNCDACYNSTIKVPRSYTFEQALAYAKKHIKDIPMGVLEWIPDSDQLDEENCGFRE